jgi:phospholipid/cholesterol/gamma-HCH transport system ATP-binding protein
LILNLCETRGMTVVVVTHELESAFKIAERIVVMDTGRVIAAGHPEEIRNSKDPRVLQFLSREADPLKIQIDSFYDCLVGGTGR